MSEEKATYTPAQWHHLMDAASDLFEALIECYQFAPFHATDCNGGVVFEEGAVFDGTKDCDCYLSRARAALGKARGER